MRMQKQGWQEETAAILRSVSKLLDQVAEESMQIQRTLGEALETGVLPDSIYRLQSLDIHTQLQRDLARVAEQLSDDVAVSRFDAIGLEAACRLPSTYSALRTNGHLDPEKVGEFHLF